MNTITAIALRIANNEQRKDALNASTAMFFKAGVKIAGRHNRRKRHLDRQTAMLEYAMERTVFEDIPGELRDTAALLSYAATVSHLMPERIDVISTNKGITEALHCRHDIAINGVVAAVARLADIHGEIMERSDAALCDRDEDEAIKDLLKP